MNKVNHNVPRFISFEGGEGAGKTTLIDSLVKELISWGIPFIKTREPGGTALGDQIRNWLLNRRPSESVSDKAELLLFLAARSQHIEEVIAPALREGKVVLCDRFNDSTIAYQGAARGLGVEWVQKLCEVVCGDILPDLTLYLDVDPKVGLARTRKVAKENAEFGKVDRIEAEHLQFHLQVREAFLAIREREPNRFYLIDANQPKKIVFIEALKVISAYFKTQKR